MGCRRSFKICSGPSYIHTLPGYNLGKDGSKPPTATNEAKKKTPIGTRRGTGTPSETVGTVGRNKKQHDKQQEQRHDKQPFSLLCSALMSSPSKLTVEEYLKSRCLLLASELRALGEDLCGSLNRSLAEGSEELQAIHVALVQNGGDKNDDYDDDDDADDNGDGDDDDDKPGTQPSNSKGGEKQRRQNPRQGVGVAVGASSSSSSLPPPSLSKRKAFENVEDGAAVAGVHPPSSSSSSHAAPPPSSAKKGKAVASSASSAASASGSSPPLRSSSSVVPSLTLSVLSGPHLSASFSLSFPLCSAAGGGASSSSSSERRRCFVGRSTGRKFKDSGVSLPKDPEVSTTHGSFSLRFGSSSAEDIYYADCGSTNGSFLVLTDGGGDDGGGGGEWKGGEKEKALEEGRECPVGKTGIVLRLGATVLLVKPNCN